MSGMTCREFDEVVHGLVRMELLDVNVREAAMEHATHCAQCAERLSDATVLAEASETAGRIARELRPPLRIEAAVLGAFRNQHRRASWRRSVEWASVGAAAALLLAFLWTVGGRSRVQLPAAPKNNVSSQSREPQEAKTPSVSKQDQEEVTAPPEAKVPVARVNETYTASDFVPVPFTGGIAPDDPGMIVRVQLTRDSLAQLGYPVAETPGEDLILADVLVGEDGWPRGVKLVP